MRARLRPTPIAALAVLVGVVAAGVGLFVRGVAAEGRPVVPVADSAATAAEGRRVEILFLGRTGAARDTSRLAPLLKAGLALDGFNFSYTTDLADLNGTNLAQYDVLMIGPDCPTLTPDQDKAIVDFLATGKGVVMDASDAARPGPWVGTTASRARVVTVTYGDDEQGWNSPALHARVRQALFRAMAAPVAAALRALNIQPLRYTDSPVPIPNYERREAPPRLQQALSPTEAPKHIQVPPGFELQLFAAEPLITGNPEAMAWDERGRLWIAETQDYPNNMQPAGQGHDVIKILEDTNRDGRADKATVFADKLSIVSSLVFSNGGIIISQAGELVALKDTNGDDKADRRETLLAGWSARDTHALASNLKYGLDNWIWGAVGYSGFNGIVGGKALNFNQALYRFTPDAKQMEHMAAFTNNTWGLGFNETGDLFGSTANGEHSDYVAIPLPYYNGVAGLSGNGKKKIDGHYALQANTRKVRQVDVQGGFTAAGGHNFYTARAFPKEYWNRVAFVYEPTGHVVHRAIIERQGSGFAEKDGWNVAASDDEWFAPVHAEVGPDGALWFLDFYDFIIQHNPTPVGPVVNGYSYLNGRGNAYDTPLREHTRGRVYRLVWKGAPKYTPLSLSATRPQELVQALKNDNMFWRITAQRLLVERGAADVVPDLVAIVNDRTVDAIGLNSPAVHALWTLQGLGALDGRNAAALDAATRALSHPAAGVRKAAQSVLPKTSKSVADVLSANALSDRDLNVRLNALLALSQMPASADAGRAIYAASKDQANISDEWLPEAIWIAATKHRSGFLQAYANEVGIDEYTRASVRGARGERFAGADWSAPSQPDTDWLTIPAPKPWAETALGEHIGTVWFRRAIEIPAAAAGKPAAIRLGIVDDTDVTYINGIRINGTASQRGLPRQYSVPAGVLVAGRNVVAVRISNVNGRGGFAGEPVFPPGVTAPVVAGTLTGMVIAGDSFSVPLSGDWRAKVEETWEGARRREISSTVSLAQQFLLANSPVADMFKAPVGGAAGASPMAGAMDGMGAGHAPANGAAAGNAPSSGASASNASNGASTANTANDGTLRLSLSVISGQMQFSEKLLTARAGQRVEITFSNTDDAQHNLVIFKRGSMADYEKELFGSMNDAFAQSRGFVPDSPNVLIASRLLNARESVVLSFVAPTEPGDYPFVCSFPGHWLMMRGVLTIQ